MEAFNSIIGAVSKYMPLATTGTGIAGLISQMSLAGKEKGALDRSVYYSKHPEAINALVDKFQKPLDTGLVKGTENIVNASMAEQGLSQAPGIQTQVLSQALAPYKQNSQQMAIMEAFRALGLPAEALAAIQSVKSPESLAMLLKGILPQSTPAPAPAPAASAPLQSDTGLTPPLFDPSQQGVNA